MSPLTSTDYRLQVRHLIRDTAGLGTTPNPALFVFSDDEIDDYVQDGLTEYTRYRKRRQPYTLALVPGQAQYDLPTDWITVDQESFDQAVAPPSEIDIFKFAGFVLPTLNPGMPLWDWSFDFYDGEQYLLVNPAPVGTANLQFAYFGVHTITATGSTVPQQDARYLSMAAASFALNALVNDKAQQLQKYKIGKGITVDDTEVVKSLTAQADKYMKQFEQRVKMTAIGVSG